MLNQLIGSAVAGVTLLLASPSFTTQEPVSFAVPDKPVVESVNLTDKQLTVLFARESYTGDDRKAFIKIIFLESRFDSRARNKESGAYGLGQALPPSKMNQVSDDWRTNPLTQLLWIQKYISERYGSPTVALEHHRKFGWY